jgi:hypothetical protein
MFFGADPVAFILAQNVRRRQLSKGQQAMAIAFAYPEPEKLKRKGSSVSEKQGISATRLSIARQVLSHSPELALAVLRNTKKLDEALAEASRVSMPSFAAIDRSVRRQSVSSR